MNVLSLRDVLAFVLMIAGIGCMIAGMSKYKHSRYEFELWFVGFLLAGLGFVIIPSSTWPW